MRTLNEYTEMMEHEYKESILDILERDCIDDITEALIDMNDDEVLEVLEHFGTSVHEMGDLDEVFDYLTPTEILDGTLDGIDTSDDYFNEDSCESSNDIWYLAGTSPRELAGEIFSSDYERYDTDIYDIACEFRKLRDELEDIFDREADKERKIEAARTLFEKMLEENVEEVLLALRGGF